MQFHGSARLDNRKFGLTYYPSPDFVEPFWCYLSFISDVSKKCVYSETMADKSNPTRPVREKTLCKLIEPPHVSYIGLCNVVRIGQCVISSWLHRKPFFDGAGKIFSVLHQERHPLRLHLAVGKIKLDFIHQSFQR